MEKVIICVVIGFLLTVSVGYTGTGLEEAKFETALQNAGSSYVIENPDEIIIHEGQLGTDPGGKREVKPHCWSIIDTASTILGQL